MAVAIGYRTTRPEALAAWDEWQADMAAHHARLRAFKESVDPDNRLALHARRNMVPVYFSGDFVPDGWRRNKTGIFPDKRYKAGKVAQAHLDELRREAPKEPLARMEGMPTSAIVGDRWHEPGAFKHDGAIYAYWGGVPEDVDLEIWTELKLSEFHAAKEAHEAETERAEAF